MTANDPSRQQEAVSHGDDGLFGHSNRSNMRPGQSRFRRLRPEGPTFLHTLEERPKRRSINLSCCEGSHSSSLQEQLLQLLQLSISTHHMVDQRAQTVVSTSRNHPCGLRHRQRPAFVAGPAVILFASELSSELAQLRVPAPRDPLHIITFFKQDTTFSVSHGHRFLVRTHSRRALSVWKRGQNSSKLSSYH